MILIISMELTKMPPVDSIDTNKVVSKHKLPWSTTMRAPQELPTRRKEVSTDP